MRAAWVALLLIIAGCSGLSGPNSAARVHIVQPGETLAGIASRYRLDYRDLARWNRLDDPNFIRAGQRLVLGPQGGSAAAGSRTAGGSGDASSRAAGAPARPASTTPAPSSPSPEWRWPTAGPIVTRFGAGDGVATGIGISGRDGQTIEAAASGRVVYAGSGLIGYGQLIIVRHNDTYLSAYGYNSRLLVEQGQAVGRGQKIAEMGLGPGRTPRLHFEIRRDGVPVDPLRFLPPR